MAHHLDKVPLGQIEGAVNGEMLSRVLRDRLQRPAPLLREAATRFNDELFGRQRYADNWFAQMLRSQEGEDHPMPSTPVPARALRAKTSSDFTIEKNPDLRLERPAAKPYGDDFYRKVVQAYQAAALIDDHPNVLLARVNKYEVTTVRGWVRTARKRNLMARGRKGSVG
ncbi:MAG: hypothetical protein Q8K58_11175 [Acidimicrobiales bacterium]|nr:hypothetical protein [Acidimicrobiales bacterium]